MATMSDSSDSDATKTAQYGVAKRAQTFFAEAIRACMSGDVGMLRGLVEAYVKDQDGGGMTVEDVIESFQSEGKTLIHVAASSGHVKVLEYVLGCCTHKASRLVNLQDEAGFTPLINATISESAESTSFLLSLGAKPSLQNKDGATALHFAAGDGSAARISLLLEKGADVAITSKSGSCLHWAAGKGHDEAVRLLISHGADVDQLSPEGLPAVLLAAVAMSEKTVIELVNAGANVGHILTGNLTLLHICAEHGMELAVRAIVATETGRKCCYIYTDDGNLPIHLAAMSAERGIVEMLLPYSVDVNNPHKNVIEPTILSISEGTSVDEIIEDGKARMHVWNEQHKPVETNPQTSSSGDSSGSSLSQEQLASAVAVPDPSHPEYATNQIIAQQHKDRGNTFFAAKNFAAARDAYTEAIKLQGDNHVLYSNRSACYIALGEPRLALRDAEICRHLNPTWPKGCYRLALARYELGLYEDAAVAAFEGCKLDENNDDLKTLMQKAVKMGREEHQKNQKNAEKSVKR
jgi:ankyrin repeat protein